MDLSPAQLVLLRELLDGRNLGGRDRTRESLRRRGLAEGQGTEFRLTAEGRKLIEDYVARTGDGPEHLKAMFRF
jgi:hypothetical protein